MMDALGFKGIWKPDPGETEDGRSKSILERMKELRREAKTFKMPEERQGPFVVECECISDTIVVGVWPDKEKTPPELALPTAITVTAALCERSARRSPPLAYRGAIAFGRFAMAETFILGPAVDEAAGNMELAEGAFVWLTPSAVKFAGGIGQSLAPRFPVPLKGGGSFETDVVRPWLARDLGQQAATAQAMLDAFKGPDLSVQIKRQNTARFYNMALAQNFAFLSDPRTPAMLKTAPLPEAAPVVR